MELALLPTQDWVEFSERMHKYRIWSSNHERYFHPASTTQILNAGGLKGFDPTHWRAKLIREGMAPHEAEEFMRRHCNHRAQVGTDFHLLVECRLKQQDVPRPVEDEAWTIFRHWNSEFLPRIGRVLIIEFPMVHRAWFYAGMPDLLAEVDGALTLVDWKSKQSREKAQRSADWVFQFAGYRELIRSEYGIDVRRAMNLMIWTDGFQPVEHNAADLAVAWDAFADALRFHHQAMADAGWPEYQLAVAAGAGSLVSGDDRC